jgi:hypothetical protein
MKFVVNHGMKRWSHTRSARKRVWCVTTVPDKKCWPCTNESDFMDATKQRSSMTGWITFPVTAVWVCNLIWLEEQMATNHLKPKSMYALCNPLTLAFQ